MDDASAAAIAGMEPVDLLRRWADFGAVWRVVSRTPHEVTVILYRCDGGEEVSRMTSSSPELLRWLAGRTCSEQSPSGS
jgi:hypothetical protein